ncbi:MAG TPA: MFS transporter [Lacisediminihabitans sp.]|nr:MFS transporter [Lacisediminihabitans sp.]HXD61289.1 MFS transporter [Lacisediminihabitans sp.]
MNSGRSWLMWAVAMIAYITAVLQRTSLGVAGVEAAHRFDVSASVLSSLTVIQLIVYAALQIPVGVILDRVGPKRLIALGALLMLLGQVTLAFAPSIGAAIGGRMLLGAGDAMTFISVIRLLASWFSGKILPQVSQWTGNVGALGQVLSAIPFSFVLRDFGWTPAFLGLAAMSALAFVLVVALLSNGGDPLARSGAATTWRGAMRQLRESLSRPGTQLGFWSHFVSQSSGTVFSLLWGFPFMVGALGYTPALASTLLASFVVVGAVSGPILGVLTARFPLRRSNLVLGIVVTMGVVWTVVLAWPGMPPLWLILVLIVAMGVGGPGSLIGFDFARSFNPLRSLGSANGVVNVGGFLASFVMMYLIGVVLDLANHLRVAGGAASDIFALDSFRVAFAVQYLVIGVGVLFLVRARRRTRRRMHEDEGIEVAPIWVALSRARKRRNI